MKLSIDSLFTQFPLLVRSTIIGFIILLCCVLSSPAYAVHGAWLLKHSGAHCKVQGTGKYQYTTQGSLKSTGNKKKDVLNIRCPINISGRYGRVNSDGSQLSAQQWASIRRSFVYVRDNNKKKNKQVACRIEAKDSSTDRIYLSQQVKNAGSGFQRIEVVVQSESGGTLESVDQDITPAGMTMRCSLPASTEIIGYDVALCKNLGECWRSQSDADYDEISSNEGRPALLQINAADCVPTGNKPEQRIRTNHWQGFSWKEAPNGSANYTENVYCPITPPALDTRRTYTGLSSLYFYYSNPIGQSSGFFAPSCRLVGVNLEGQYTQSDYLIRSQQSENYHGYVTNSNIVGPDVVFPTDVYINIGLLCDLRESVSLRGGHVRHTITREDGGI